MAYLESSLSSTCYLPWGFKQYRKGAHPQLLWASGMSGQASEARQHSPLAREPQRPPGSRLPQLHCDFSL